MENPILTRIENQIGFITLNRPEKRNALSPELIGQLASAFNVFENEPRVKVVILEAEGKAFCAGADLDYIQQMQHFSFDENLADSNRLKSLFAQIYEFPKVVISQVQGHALAGGCGLVTVCDFAFAAPEALFGYTEVKIGFIPALVSVFLSEQIGQAKTTEMLLSGELISSSKSVSLGLITEVVEREFLEKRTREFAEKLATANSPFSMQETKRLLRSLGKAERDRALDLAAEANAKARGHADCVKGIAAFLGKSKPSW
ncbi:enoyl-CoA hydratase/isomerase family protein [Algoriphagus boritolerans]|uniref:Methylglutaconyl-CoA hydratase n=1 Tax=Algoriphagus boritolerans DSM 17298 = JCM 18970 TaxID=1120964 RepID=A0A1H5ZZX0_9BACT|nr:enoyl-CoA hydratase-related protein [Algoriphagus boritolerans]SEG41741.1 methylglutaconyl-CoA hydratase [Algoriphagus boritolerans DSM 17298 = JCM 18970]